MSGQFDIAADLEAVFEQEIRCGECGKRASLRSLGHRDGDCGPGVEDNDPPFYKCLDCYLSWRDDIMGTIRIFGNVGCASCLKLFPSPEAFSDFREF